MSITRRKMIKGTVAGAALAFAQVQLPSFTGAAPSLSGELVPFLDVLPTNPNRPMVQWDELTDWITPEESCFSVSHYGTPKIETPNWRLEISGLVNKARTFTLADIK